MTLLSASDLRQIKSDIADIVEDTSINTTLRYRQQTGEDYYDPEEQQWYQMHTNWSGVSALKGLVTRSEQSVTSGVEIGDVKFVIMQSAVSDVLSVADMVVESGVTYNVKQVAHDPLDIVYIIYCQVS